MKINRLIRKYYIDIFFLIILLVIILGGAIASKNATADITMRDKLTPHTATADLME